jgi:hypothetical protein
MAGTDAGQMSATSVRSAISGSGGNHKGVDRCLDREGTSNSGRRRENKAESNAIGSPLSLIVAIEQWICLLLEIACIVSGALGICMNPGQHDLPTHLAWVGLGYVPLLRITAAACLALGVVLVRLG